MKRVEIVLMPLNQFGKNGLAGRHIKPERFSDIHRALEDLNYEGTLYIYARMPSKPVSDWLKHYRVANSIEYTVTHIPGGLSGRGGYLVEREDS